MAQEPETSPVPAQAGTAVAAARDHPAFLAHHFDTPSQQFESGKLGLWLFLTTEILLFGGLFCVYAVYRSLHPGIFEYAHQYLSKTLGATNTLVLIFSSFTMAWAVRAAQLGQRKLLIGLLSITLFCGAVFLGIKAVEYQAKFAHHTLPGLWYQPTEPPAGADVPEGAASKPAAAVATSAPAPGTVARSPEGWIRDEATVPAAAVGPQGLAADYVDKIGPRAEGAAWKGPEPDNVQIFFGIYFAMTGLHAVHVLAGMVCIAWILRRAIRGDFGPRYYNPVDFTGLYWHLVDVIWIFLFPLLYLIH